MKFLQYNGSNSLSEEISLCFMIETNTDNNMFTRSVKGEVRSGYNGWIAHKYIEFKYSSTI